MTTETIEVVKLIAGSGGILGIIGIGFGMFFRLGKFTQEFRDFKDEIKDEFEDLRNEKKYEVEGIRSLIFDKFRELKIEMNERFEKIEERFNRLENEFINFREETHENFSIIKQRLVAIETRIEIRMDAKNMYEEYETPINHRSESAKKMWKRRKAITYKEQE